MKKRILALVVLLTLILTSNVFAYRWVQNGSDWYVYDDNSNELCKNALVDVGNTVYYFDSTGKMVTGWWVNAQNGKVYFFDNNTQRNYGSMTFGLKTVDGYYRYFTADGSLARSDKAGEYKKVYGEYWADYTGNLYFDNQILRDTSTNKSDFYTNQAYYLNAALNNEYLFKYDKAADVPIQVDSVNKASQAMIEGADVNTDKSGTKVTGGTNYTVDSNGKITDNSAQLETSAFEKLGPMVDTVANVVSAVIN